MIDSIFLFTLLISSGASVLIARRMRDKYIRYQAGHIFRKWVYFHCAQIMSDKESTNDAKIFARYLIECASNPPTLQVSLETSAAVNHDDISIIGDLGSNIELLQNILKHIGVLAVINDERVGRSFSKIVTGYQETSEWFSDMKSVPESRMQSASRPGSGEPVWAKNVVDQVDQMKLGPMLGQFMKVHANHSRA